SVIRENTTSLSNNPLLSDLTVTPGTFTPEFNPAIMYYTVTVDYSVDEITIGATTSNPNATVEGLGNKEISLNYHQFMITSTSEDWSSEMHYYINVYRVPSTDATLSDLTVSEGTLTPAFDPEISDYTVTVGNDITGLDIGAIANQTNATITGTGPKTNLYLGANSFAITVTAENGITRKVYNVVVIREASDDALLSSLSVAETNIYPTFNPIRLNYSVGFLSDVSQINVSATTNNENAHILSGIGIRDLAMGDNPIDIIVLAEDEETEIFYYLSAYRQSNDTTLSELEVSEGTLIPAFDPTILDYTVSIPYEITEIAISITTNNINAGYSGDGLKTNLIIGENPFVITVWAEDDRFSQDYNVVVTREAYVASTDASLSELTVSEGTLTPEFDPATLNYTVTVPNEITELTIGATANDDKASVAGAGLKDNLLVGANPFAITVTAEDGATELVYNVVVTREASTDATLSDLTVSEGTLTPAFVSTTLDYTVTVDNSITQLTIGSTATHVNATVSGAGLKDNLLVGANPFAITVTAEDGATTLVYNVVVTRQAPVLSTDATLSDLTVSEGTLTPAFVSTTLDYTVTVANSITQLTIAATATHANATVSGAGLKDNLLVGANPFAITVTAEDGATTLVYNVVVTREAPVMSTDATLSDLTVSEGTLTPAFNPEILYYTISLCSMTTTSIVIGATANHSNALVAGDGAHLLSFGENSIPVVVTAENGEVSSTYTITIYLYPSYITLDTAAICAGGTYDFFGAVLTEAGTYSHTLQTIHGCDSIITLTLTVIPLPGIIGIIQGRDAIPELGEYVYSVDPVENATHYEWNISNEKWGIDNHLARTIKLDVNSEGSGLLTVVGLNDCGASETATLSISTTINITCYEAPLEMIVYPNPTQGNVEVKIEDGKFLNGNLDIYTDHGKIIRSLKMDNFVTRISIADLPTGVYFFVFTDSDNLTRTFKVAKQ
ncbi:cadherin-like beta sandwich domain-containing protein, partial [Bacteroidales bacterium OttesenSCG-928-B11]|nr:cadherin-like beta sandwich domain-containing protein [Bacteroidales bacterium OttesenSCG-928-B11]MDL2326587.1 cadherin-like beta sandwich domain-containing protein [Bacteroidales bacterium OttesenSCG-928-A14]